ncbi:hypothetical protein T492DRAFT_1100744 [Pavlovales sp. CCMP2436]|nr:hypothetical protein T492DRAFT_1100744 [Pavlovales sp. CCMP2436]
MNVRERVAATHGAASDPPRIEPEEAEEEEEEAEEEEAAAAAQPREQPVEQQPPPPIVPAAPLAAPEPEQNDNDSGPSELFEFRLQICAHDANDNLVAVHTKCERDDTFPSRNTVKVANKQKYTLVFQVANTCVPFDSLLAVRVGEFDVPIRKQLRSNNEFVCEGFWDTTEIAPTGDKFRIQMPVRVAYLLGNEKYCRETEFILQMKVYDAKDSKKAQQGGTPLDCISCKFYRTSSRSVNYPTFLRT